MIGRSELCWAFWTRYKDVSDIAGFCWIFSMKKLDFHPQDVLIRCFLLPVSDNAIY